MYIILDKYSYHDLNSIMRCAEYKVVPVNKMM